MVPINIDPHTLRVITVDQYGNCIEETTSAYEPNVKVRKKVPCPENIEIVEGALTPPDSNNLNEEEDDFYAIPRPSEKAEKKVKSRRKGNRR